MKRFTISLFLVITGALLLRSSAAVPERAEMKLRDKWLARHFDAGAATVPFSFAYGGRASGDLLPSWKATRAKSKPGGAPRTLTWTDPATGLRVCAEIKAFADLPAVEWVLRFENQGRGDTPILERILPLDVAFAARSQDKAVIHHSVGEKNTGQSFAPVEDVLAPGGSQPLVFAPVGGRSSDGCMPFFNLALPDGGVAMAVGWSGQWEARFQRSARGELNVGAGQQLIHCKLRPGESIRTPRMLLVFWRGAEPLRGNNLLRQVLMTHYMPRRNGELVLSPICASVNWAAPDGSYEEPHVSVMQPLARPS